MKINVFFISFFCLFAACNSFAAEKTVIRIGAQAFGTVDWELSALQDDPQTKSADFQLELHNVANAEAGKIALQSGAVDMIVSDWIWVSRLRATGADFTFYPYSDTSGALLVPDKSAIHSVQDLKGKRLAIAGGELDKNWLLLQALAQREKFDLTALWKKFSARRRSSMSNLNKTMSMPRSITGILPPVLKARVIGRSLTARAF